MATQDKVRVLLADEDALRRDGLAAVLGNSILFSVVAQCPDGEAAMDAIRKSRPDVAVVDLNLPRVHGIEIIRRVRGETIGTKILILAGTDDEDVIREVVRAGGDGYLLKNGPARHLIDALSYICDGGQYFSPQIGRDGRDRHLLEEPARIVAPVERPAKRRTARESSRRTSDPRRLRERLREDGEAGDLEERDYEILTIMADGIKPILDRLDDIEGRIGDMETGDAPVPANVRGWLSNQLEDTLQSPRAVARQTAPAPAIGDLEARLPLLIEQAVTTRFHNMASRLQQEIEETHIRTLETFVRNIQVKLVQRVSALETDMSKQAEAMSQLREYSQRTEDNLSRLITGVDKLAQELPKRLQAAETPALDAPPAPSRSGKSRKFPRKWPLFGAVIVATAAIGGVKLFNRQGAAESPGTGSTSAAVSAASATSTATAVPGDAKSGSKTDWTAKMQAAEQYTERKDYASAEDIYKQVLKAEPDNVDALKALASVLYREDKIEESTAVLDKVPRN
jgi:DNA-binding NarL/FixJ family response regulator